MNVAEAFQQVHEVNEKHGIETGVSVCLGVNGVRTTYDYNEGKEFQAVGATEIAVAHVLAQHCPPDWLQESQVHVSENDAAAASNQLPEAGLPTNRCLLKAMLSDNGDPGALQNLTRQAAVLEVPAYSDVNPNMAQFDLQLQGSDQIYGTTTPFLAQSMMRAYAIAETSVVRRVASRAMTAEFPSFGVRNVFTSRQLHTTNSPVHLPKYVVVNKLGSLNTGNDFVRSDIGYVMHDHLVLSYAFFGRGHASPRSRETVTRVAENSMQLMGSILHSYVVHKHVEIE